MVLDDVNGEREIIVMNEFLPCVEVRLDVGKRVTEHACPALTVTDFVGCYVPVPEAEVGYARGKIKTFFARAQSIFGAHMIGDVVHDGIQQRFVFGLQRAAENFDIADFSRRQPMLELKT